MKTIFTKWEYKGRKLANPVVIAKRLICMALMWILVIPLYCVIWIGWGKLKADIMLGTIN
jgi:hypothetical protein